MRYLYLQQKAEGCDYTIGCGETLESLEHTTVEEILENYGVGHGENDIECAIILEVVEDAMPLVHARCKAVQEKEQADDLAEKEAEFERLKKELGK